MNWQPLTKPAPKPPRQVIGGESFPTNIQFRPVRAQLTAYRQIYNVIQLVVYVTIFGLIAAIINTTVDTGAWFAPTYPPLCLVFTIWWASS